MTNDISTLVTQIGQAARLASRELASSTYAQRTSCLKVAAKLLRTRTADVLTANAQDVEAAKAKGLTPAFVDRLLLDEARVEGLAKAFEGIASQKDPIGHITKHWTTPSGLRIQRVQVPLGVLGMIFEARPGVCVEAGGLGVLSGNAVVLRGGSDSFHSSRALVAILQEALSQSGLPVASVQTPPTTDRAFVVAMLQGLNGCMDVVAPRGGKSLVEEVFNNARIPVFGHMEGICHMFVDASAKPDMALNLVLNSKMRRTGICNSLETLLLHQNFPSVHKKEILEALVASGCEVRGCADVQRLLPSAKLATEEDWRTEYLDAILSVKVVKNLADAMEHIRAYSTGHTESIVTESDKSAERFLRDVDSAVVMHNTSTQFSDGGQFGFGGEIGISTSRFHARGPIGAEQLTIGKYVVESEGLCRPQ